MKLNDLKKIIKEEIAKVLSEAETAPAPVKTPAQPTTKPGKSNPGLTPNKETTPKERPAKAQKKKTNEVSQGIANIVKKYKSLKGK